MELVQVIPHRRLPFDDRAGECIHPVPKGCGTAFAAGLLILGAFVFGAGRSSTAAPVGPPHASPLMQALAQVQKDQAEIRALRSEAKELRRELDHLKGRR